MSIKRGTQILFRVIFFFLSVFLAVFLYHSYFEPFRNSHPEYFRWISEYDVPDQVTIIERKEQVTVTESDFVSKLIVNSQNAVVTVVSSPAIPGSVPSKSASGFFITNDGVVAVPTKNVSFEKGMTYKVFSMNGETNDAILIGSDSLIETTFLRTERKNAPTLTIAPQDAFFVGRNILLLSRSLEGSTPVAQTSSLAELAKTTNIANQSIGSSEKYEGVGKIEPGDYVQDGSAVITYQGELLGMIHEISFNDRTQIVILPIRALTDSLTFLSQGEGKSTRSFLGVSYVSLTPELATMYNLPLSSGAWVKVSGSSATGVFFGSPAYLAGVRQGDIITSVNDIPLTLDTPLSYMVSQYKPGDKIEITIYRDGSRKNVTVLLVTEKAT